MAFISLENDLASMAGQSALESNVKEALQGLGVDLNEISDVLDDYFSGALDEYNFVRSIASITGIGIAKIQGIMDSITEVAPEAETSNGYIVDIETAAKAFSSTMGIPESILLQEFEQFGAEVNAEQVYSVFKDMGIQNEIPFTSIQSMIDDLASSSRGQFTGM